MFDVFQVGYIKRNNSERLAIGLSHHPQFSGTGQPVAGHFGVLASGQQVEAELKGFGPVVVGRVASASLVVDDSHEIAFRLYPIGPAGPLD